MTQINMSEQLGFLVELQALDIDIYKRRKVLEEVPGKLKELDDAFAQKKEVLKEAEEGLKKFQLEQKKKEGELATKEETVKKYKNQLLQIKTNQEYTSMEKQIASIEADSSLLEEEIIGLLDRVEEAQKNIAGEKKLIDEETKRVSEEKKKIEDEKKACQAGFDELCSKRKEFALKLEKTVLSKYERILHNRDGVAMVPVAGDSCGGCNMNLPPQVINEIGLKASLTFCENCARILYSKE